MTRIHARAAIALLLALFLAGCGQKGALKLPETPPAKPAALS